MSNILKQDIMYVNGVGPTKKQILNKELGIMTIGDMLEYYPYKYVDRSRIYTISSLTQDMSFVQIKGRILSFETFQMGVKKKRLVAHFGDGTGVVDLVWFSGTQYITKNFKVGIDYIVFGKPGIFGGRFQFSHPEIEKAENLQLSQMGMQPYYVTTEKMKNSGLTSRSMEKIAKAILTKMPELPETLPDYITTPLHLVSRDTAVRNVHYPKSQQDMHHRRKYKGYMLPRIGEHFRDFFSKNLKFELTGAQKRVMHEIQADMNTGRQMNRLVQGDVGSGKTLVALMAMLIAVDNGFQACIMAPTEILAEQHLATVQEFLKGLDVKVELLTGIVKGKKRKVVLEQLVTGEIDILVGTHALIEETVQFKNLGLAVVDEQHRFGVAQRAKLWAKNQNPPHILVMTATPIPRTLAMTIYGDLDVSVIDELPPGRKPIQTLHKYDNQTTSLFNGIRQQIGLGRQVYIVYPLITESEKIDLKNLEEGYEYLQKVFPEYRMSKVHGRMKSAEKEEEMQKFISGETQILVATTVIEVGVNVPNASVMVIMDAQRFGLSQLHQLRGRVGRGADQSYCILVTGHELAQETRKRMEIMTETNDGFRIAEADLKLRGPGDLEGTQQSGLAFDLKIADIARDGQLVQLARDEAQKIIDDDPECNSPHHAMLWRRLNELRKDDVDWAQIS